MPLQGTSGAASANAAKAKASAFSPLSLSPKVWYRADLGVTESSGSVSQWNDNSANAHHVTQGTGANQPAWSATSGANGLPGITFDGSNDIMTATFTGISQPFHAFSVMKTTTVSGTASLIAGGSLNERFHDFQTGGCFVYFGASGITRSPSHSDSTNFYWWEYLINGASSSVVRGNAAATTGSVGSNTLTGITFGRLLTQGFAAGVISEFMVFPAEISGTNLTNLRAYCTARYGLSTL